MGDIFQMPLVPEVKEFEMRVAVIGFISRAAIAGSSKVW